MGCSNFSFKTKVYLVVVRVAVSIGMVHIHGVLMAGITFVVLDERVVLRNEGYGIIAVRSNCLVKVLLHDGIVRVGVGVALGIVIGVLRILNGIC